MSKYHSTKVITPDGKFDSKKEYKRWLELKDMQMHRKISDLQRQVPFKLIPNQKSEDGKVIERSITYFADFTYFDNEGNLIVEDVKGLRTPEYKLKRKMMLWFRGIRIKEV